MKRKLKIKIEYTYHDVCDSDFKKAKNSNQLVEQGYKDFLSPEGRKLNKKLK